MAILAVRWLLLGVAAIGCGKLAPPGGGNSNLPASGAGPYQLLAANDDSPIDEPLVLSDASADLDDAWALGDGDTLEVWITYRRGKTSEIRRAQLPSVEQGASELETALSASASWQQGIVSQPSVLRGHGGHPWLLFYSGGGDPARAIGCATSPDGQSWSDAPAPVLIPTSEEQSLSSPAAVELPGGRIRLFYLAPGGLRAAEGDRAALENGAPLPLSRFDPNPSTATIDPILAPGAATWLPTIGRVTARTLTTAAHRVRYDLFLTGLAETSGGAVRTVGLAASYDAERFSVASAPFVTPRKPELWAPTVVAYRNGSLLLATQQKGARSAIVGAISP